MEETRILQGYANQSVTVSIEYNDGDVVRVDNNTDHEYVVDDNGIAIAMLAVVAEIATRMEYSGAGC